MGCRDHQSQQPMEGWQCEKDVEEDLCEGTKQGEKGVECAYHLTDVHVWACVARVVVVGSVCVTCV